MGRRGASRAVSGRRLLAVSVLALALTACASAEPDVRAESAGDLELLVQRLEQLHPEPYHDVSRADFRAAVDELAGRLGGLDADERLVGLMRLGALLGPRDGHGGVYPLDLGHRRRLHLYPVRLYAFPEGLVVVGEVGRSRGLVGRRLVAIGGVPVARALEAVRPLVPRDNEHSRAARLPQYLVVAEVLHGLGLVPSAGPLRFRFAGGREVVLAPVGARRYTAAFPDLAVPQIPQGLPTRPRPAFLARRLEQIWTRTLDRGRALYVGYNFTLPWTGDVAEWVRRLAARPSVRRVIVDLRNNPGGDNGTYAPLLRALQRLPGRVRIVVLTSRATFSAAGNLAADLERTTNALFVGEATGASPNQYGDPNPVALPQLGLTFHVATVWWQKSERGKDDPRLAIEPDVPVTYRAADFVAGRDPVLAAALR
jgi:hypothetical protein